MFFSQRLHRCINSAILVSAQESAKEMLGIVKKGDFSRLFMKSTIRKNKLADMAKTKRINRNFLDIVEKAKWVNEMKSSSLFPDDSPDEPVDITRLSLRNLSNCVNLEALRSQYQHSLPKVDSVRDYDDSGEDCNDSDADDIQTLRGLEDLCDIQASDSKYDMWYVPGKLAAEDNQELEYCDKQDLYSSYDRRPFLGRRESACSSGTDSDETLGACYRGDKEAACNRSENEAVRYRGENEAACFRDENEAACYDGENEAAAFYEVSKFSGQTPSTDRSASYVRNGQYFTEDESEDEESGLLTWDKNRGQSRGSARASSSERYRPHSMQSSQREHNKPKSRGVHALNLSTAQPLNVASMSKQELLHLWKSSELQLNYLLQNTLRENIELKKSLSQLQKRRIKDTAV